MTELAVPPPSPCVRQCCLDDADTCLGCGRTLQEILDWHTADSDGRAAILARATARLAARRLPQTPSRP